MHSGEALLKAIKIIGSRQETIKLLGISGQRLNSWLNGHVSMGYHFAIALQSLTLGQVMAKELAPKKQTNLLEKLKIDLGTHITWLRRQQVSITSITFSSSHEDEQGLAKLAEDIKTQGLLRPIVIDNNHTLIFGKRRLCACQLLNKNRVSAHILSLEALLKDPEPGYQLKKYFTLSEIGDIGVALEAKLGKRQGQRNDLSLRRNLDEVTGRTDQWVACLLQIGSKDSYRQLKKVNKNGIRALIAVMDEEKISLSAAAEIAALSPEIQQQILSAGDSKCMMEKLKQLKINKKFINKNNFYSVERETSAV